MKTAYADARIQHSFRLACNPNPNGTHTHTDTHFTWKKSFTLQNQCAYRAFCFVLFVFFTLRENKSEIRRHQNVRSFISWASKHVAFGAFADFCSKTFLHNSQHFTDVASFWSSPTFVIWFLSCLLVWMVVMCVCVCVRLFYFTAAAQRSHHFHFHSHSYSFRWTVFFICTENCSISTYACVSTGVWINY